MRPKSTRSGACKCHPGKYPLDPCNLYYPTFTANPPPNVRQPEGLAGHCTYYCTLLYGPASVWLRASAPAPPRANGHLCLMLTPDLIQPLFGGLCAPAQKSSAPPAGQSAQTNNVRSPHHCWNSGELLLPWPQTPPRYSNTNRNGRSNRKLQPFSSPSSPKLRAPGP